MPSDSLKDQPGASVPGFFLLSGGGHPGPRRPVRVLLTLLPLLLAASALAALDIGGFARIFWTDTDADGQSSQNLEQQLRLGVQQRFSPYLTLALNHSHIELTNRSEGNPELSRRLRQPELSLLYNRPDLTARLGYSYRRADGTFDLDNFEAEGLTAGLFWRARPYLRFNFTFRDEVNETDVAALGRNTGSRTYLGSVRFDRGHWNAGYDYSHSELENRSTGLRSDQDRHDLRVSTGRSFFDDRLTLSAHGQVGRLERDQEVPAGAELAEPVPAVQGLFAVELNPTVGDLAPSPGLIDGDFETPVSPSIEIGGAATFRNIGLDLGITTPITRLEISVDQPSGTNLGWEVYRSRDNLLWEPVPGVLSEWDGGLLRYTLRFPETTDRFFKAVNVTANPASRVLVTELRALRDLPRTGVDGEARTDLYRLDLSAGYKITERARLGAGFGSRNDESTVAGLVRQDRRLDYANAAFDLALTGNLDLGLDYAWTDSEDRRNPELDRTTVTTQANLRWTPLSTVRMLFAAGTYEEYRRNTLLQSSRLARLGVSLRLLPDLWLNTDLRYSQLDDPFTGSDRDSWSWNLALQAQLRSNWSLRGGYSHRLTESVEGEPLLESTGYDLRTTWSPGRFLTLNGEWRLTVTNSAETLRQTYGLLYSPGPKLSITTAWARYETDLGRVTEDGTATIGYRVYRRVLIWGTSSRSRTEQSGGADSKIRSAQLGLTVEF